MYDHTCSCKQQQQVDSATAGHTHKHKAANFKPISRQCHHWRCRCHAAPVNDCVITVSTCCSMYMYPPISPVRNHHQLMSAICTHIIRCIVFSSLIIRCVGMCVCFYSDRIGLNHSRLDASKRSLMSSNITITASPSLSLFRDTKVFRGYFKCQFSWSCTDVCYCVPANKRLLTSHMPC